MPLRRNFSIERQSCRHIPSAYTSLKATITYVNICVSKSMSLCSRNTYEYVPFRDVFIPRYLFLFFTQCSGNTCVAYNVRTTVSHTVPFSRLEREQKMCPRRPNRNK